MGYTDPRTGRWISDGDDPELEPRRVEAWRIEHLAAAGYGPEEAAALAHRGDVDLHVAVRLRKNGCPGLIALRILL